MWRWLGGSSLFSPPVGSLQQNRTGIRGFRRAFESEVRPSGAAGFRAAHQTGSLLTLRYIWRSNMRTPNLIPIDSFDGSCTIGLPDRILIPQRRFRMAIEAHLVELERKHKVLENELHEALVHLSTDDLQIVELKRRKLMVKDEIERLRHTASETLH
jgi:hypothetical protein